MTQLFDQDYLRKLEYLELIARRQVFGQRHAQRVSSRKGSSIEFKDFREYVSGDDPRSVDWSVYARLGELVIKLFRQEQELDLWTVLDRSRSMSFGEPSKFDFARRVAGALSYIGMAGMDSASVVTFSQTLESGCQRLRGRGQVFRLLEYLEALQSEGDGGEAGLVGAAKAFVARVRRPGLVVLISDLYGLSEACKAIDLLRFHKHQVYVLQVTTGWELDPTIRGDLRLTDIETGRHAEIVVTDQMLRKYKDGFQLFVDTIKGHCMRSQVGYSLVTADTPFEEFVGKSLQRGGLVA